MTSEAPPQTDEMYAVRADASSSKPPVAGTRGVGYTELHIGPSSGQLAPKSTPQPEAYDEHNTIGVHHSA